MYNIIQKNTKNLPAPQYKERVFKRLFEVNMIIHVLLITQLTVYRQSDIL